MIDVSPLKKRKYLYELRQQMGSWSDFGLSRFTGLILGNFFHITRHSDFEWDRRYGSPKSRAIGFVTKAGDETQVWALCFYGDIDPITMIRNFVLWFLLTTFVFVIENIGAVGRGASIVDLFSSILSHPQTYLYGVAFAFLLGLGTALGYWFTERGRQNMEELRSLLQNPMRFWADEEECEQ